MPVLKKPSRTNQTRLVTVALGADTHAKLRKHADDFGISLDAAVQALLRGWQQLDTPTQYIALRRKP